MKGQVTIFVIIGLALLLGVGLFMVARDAPDVSLSSSQDAARITQFTQACLASVGEDVLREIGANGGYYSVSQFRDTGNMRDTQVVDLAPQKVVLWHEIHPCTENPAGCLSDNRPPLCESGTACPVPGGSSQTSIQEELERGVAERIDSCLDFSAFPDLTVQRNGEPEVSVLIREEDIVLSMEYSLDVTNTAGERVELEEYAASLDVALPDLYRFAVRIQEAQQGTAFLENAFLQLLATYSGADEELPPFREVELFGSTRYWMRTEVQQAIEESILPFMNVIQIINAEESFSPIMAAEVEETYRPYAEGFYQYFIVKVDEEIRPYAAQIEYPYTPIFLDINGKELLRPNQLGGGGFLAKFTGMLFTQYKFRYTVAFPVIVHLSDPAAFNGQGYQLNFGLEANIRNNRPLNVSIAPVNLVSTYTTLDLSDPQQLVNHTYTLDVRDQHTGEPIPGVMINYECDARYYMGETDAAGKWRGKLPYCFAGGALVVQKQGYLGTGNELLNAQDDGASSIVEIGVWPRRQKTVTVYKISANDTLELLAGIPRSTARSEFGENDSLVLEIIRRAQTPYDEEVPLGGIVQFGKQGKGAVNQLVIDDLIADLNTAYEAGGFEGQEAQYQEALAMLQEQQTEQEEAEQRFVSTQQVDLVPGTYDLQGTLIYAGLLQIPEKEECQALGLVCNTLPAQNYTSWVSGGVILNGGRALVLEPEDIYADTNITIYVLEQQLPASWDDLKKMAPFEEYQATYGRPDYVRPEIS